MWESLKQVIFPALIIGLLSLVLSYVIYGCEDIDTFKAIVETMRKDKTPLVSMHLTNYENKIKNSKFKVSLFRSIALVFVSIAVLYLAREYYNGLEYSGTSNNLIMHTGATPF